jgi:hypothetical protein
MGVKLIAELFYAACFFGGVCLMTYAFVEVVYG